jgi:hypothetical protein
MRRLSRYGIAFVVAGTVTTVAGTATGSVLLLAGIWQTYAAGTAVALRPEVRRVATALGETSSAVFAGVTTFGVLSVGQGLSDGFHAPAAILALGLAYFGLVCGIGLLAEVPLLEEGP